MFEAIYNFVSANPLLVMLILLFIYQKWKGSQPWPEFGGNITAVHTKAEWDALLSEADYSRRLSNDNEVRALRARRFTC